MIKILFFVAGLILGIYIGYMFLDVYEDSDAIYLLLRECRR